VAQALSARVQVQVAQVQVAQVTAARAQVQVAPQTVVQVVVQEPRATVNLFVCQLSNHD
jgi:hypothetical protein